MSAIPNPEGWYPLPTDPAAQPPYHGTFQVGLWPPGSGVLTPDYVNGKWVWYQGITKGTVEIPSGLDASNITIANPTPRGIELSAGASKIVAPGLSIRNYPIDLSFERQGETLDWKFVHGVPDKFQPYGVVFPNSGDPLSYFDGFAVDGRTVRYSINDNQVQPTSLIDIGFARPVDISGYAGTGGTLSGFQTNGDYWCYSVADGLANAWAHSPWSAISTRPEYITVGLQINFADTRRSFNRILFNYDDTDWYALVNIPTQPPTRFSGINSPTLCRIPAGTGQVFVSAPGAISFQVIVDGGDNPNAFLTLTAWVICDV